MAGDEQVLAVVRGGEGIDPVHQKDQVGEQGILLADFIHLPERFPAGMVVTNGRRQRCQWRETVQQLRPGQGMLFGIVPLQFLRQMLVHPRRRDPAVMQQGGVEQPDSCLLIKCQGPGTLHRHKADTLAVADLVHPHQVEGIGKGVDGLAKINVQFHRILDCLVVIYCAPR